MSQLKFTYDNMDYFIQFAYTKNQCAWQKSIERANKPVPTNDLSHNLTPVQDNVTTCTILMGEVGCSTKDMKSFIEGNAYRSVFDNFNKEKGRKISLTNALTNARSNTSPVGKEFRKTAWATYLNRGGKKYS